MKCFLCETELIQRQSISGTHCCPNDDCLFGFYDIEDIVWKKVVLKKDIMTEIPKIVKALDVIIVDEFMPLSDASGDIRLSIRNRMRNYLTEKFNSL